MTRVLVTGGTGTLGSAITPRLEVEGYTVRVMSRSLPDEIVNNDYEWVKADLSTDGGLSGAVNGVDTVIHAATNPRHSKSVDVEGTKRLLSEIESSDVETVIYPSIVGIDAWDGAPFPYYNRKLAAEELLEDADVNTVIQRATQFHSFVNGGLEKLRWVPVWPLPSEFQIQPIEVEEVARRLTELVDEPTDGRVADIGGPEVFSMGEAARQWQSVHGIRRPVVRIPIPGTTAGRVRDGAMTAPETRLGSQTWRAWLENGKSSDRESERVAAT